jgi:hypothetical protein
MSACDNFRVNRPPGHPPQKPPSPRTGCGAWLSWEASAAKQEGSQTPDQVRGDETAMTVSDNLSVVEVIAIGCRNPTSVHLCFSAGFFRRVPFYDRRGS